MMHKSRVFQIAAEYPSRGGPYDTPGEIATLLTEHTWCGCQGFRLGSFLFLNDSTGPDGAQEYAVFDERIGKQVESLTVSWMTAGELESVIRHLMSDVDEELRPEPFGSMPSLEHPKGPCYACA